MSVMVTKLDHTFAGTCAHQHWHIKVFGALPRLHLYAHLPSPFPQYSTALSRNGTIITSIVLEKDARIAEASADGDKPYAASMGGECLPVAGDAELALIYRE